MATNFEFLKKESKFSSFADVAISAENIQKSIQKTVLIVKLKMNIVEASVAVISFFLIRASLKPLSINCDANEKKIAVIPTMP